MRKSSYFGYIKNLSKCALFFPVWGDHKKTFFPVTEQNRIKLIGDNKKSIQKINPGKNRLKFRSLEKWLKWQESLHFTAVELGLERCRRVANNMGLLNPPYDVISVAGTNGKGSSITLLDSILRNSGYKIGRYTSPHLLRYNERICVNGKEVEDAELCESFDRIDRARGDISLTYFEFGTLAAHDLFRVPAAIILVLGWKKAPLLA